METSNLTSPARTQPLICLRPTPKIAGFPKTITGDELRADSTHIKPLEFVAGLFHRRSICVIASTSKAGKSSICIDLSVSIAMGIDFWGLATAQGRVLMVNGELPPVFMKERLDNVMQRRGVTDASLIDVLNLRGINIECADLISYIIREAEGKDYMLIILDPLYMLMGSRSENSGSSVKHVCEQLERLAVKTGAAVVFAHHFPKGNAKKKSLIDRLAGSGLIVRAADTILCLTPHTEQDCFTVETVCRNFPPLPSFVVQRDHPVMVVREDLEPEDLLNEGVDDGTDHGVLALLDAGPLRSGAWEAQALGLGISRATFHRVKKALRENGHINFDRQTREFSQAIRAADVQVVSSVATQVNQVAETTTGSSQTGVMPIAPTVRPDLSDAESEKFGSL